MIFAGFAATAAFGLPLLPRRMTPGPFEGLALGFLLVSFGLSLELFALGWLGAGWGGWWAAAPWAVLAAWRLAKAPPAFAWEDGWLPALPAALAAAAVLAVWLPYERAMPLTSQSWDAWAIWLFKAKAFYVDGALAPYYARASEFVGQPGYPLLTPLYSTWLYSLAGEPLDGAAKAASPCYFLALLGAFHYAVRRAAGAAAAGVFTALLALTPMLQRTAFELAGYADTALAAYAAAAVGLGWLWLRDGRTEDLAAASLAATAAAWTKNEGQFLLAGLGAALALKLTVERKPVRDWAWLVAPPALVLGAWSAARSAFAVEAAGFAPGLDFHPDLFGTALREMLRKALDTQGFGLTFWLLPAAAAMLASFRAGPAAWLAPGMAAWQWAGALLAYATGRNEIGWWLETSADRLLTHAAPAALLAAGGAYAAWASATAAAPAPAPARESPPKRRRGRG